MHLYASDSTHGGLYGFGTIGIGGAYRAEDVAYAKPVGHSDDGAQVSWVLDVVEGKA